MERVIKFRGKRQGIEGWLYFDLLHHISDDTGIPPDFLQYPLIPETVGQLWIINHDFEIYTDDLFTAICSPSGSNNKKERICKVTFDGSGMKAVVWYKNEWWHYGSMNFTTIKIIGNIHDNPELLK